MTPHRATIFLFILTAVLLAPGSAQGQARCVSDLDCVKLFQENPPKKAYTRKDWNSLTQDEVCSIVKGVAAMKALPAANPLSWQYQANIHGLDMSVPRKEAEDCCQHSGWYFLAWHRMEAFYFERILRAMSGDDNLVLPYWNFTVLDSDPNWRVKRAIPAAFRTPKITCAGKEVDNPLYDAKRNKGTKAGCGINDGEPLCQSVVDWRDAFDTNKFWDADITNGAATFGGAKTGTGHFSDGRASGRIESQPHNQMHVMVGGPGGDLTDPDGAASDPIFWPFHVNIDRAWYCWDKKFNKTGTYPQFAEPWWSTKFKFFDVQKSTRKGPDGQDVIALTAKPVCLSAKQVALDAVNLQYKYDSCYPFPPPADDETQVQSAAANEDSRILASATVQAAITLGPEGASVSLELPSDVQLALAHAVSQRAAESAVILTVQGIEVNKPVSALYQVFVNLPKDTRADSATPYFAGNLSFFGAQEHLHDGEAQPETSVAGGARSFDVTQLVQRLAASPQWRGNELTVTFVGSRELAEANCGLENCPAAACPMCLGGAPAAPDEHIVFSQVSLAVVGWTQTGS